MAFRQPLVLDKDKVIIIGHGRFEAAKNLGYTEVPCVIADDLTEEQVRKLRIVDNRTNESAWDIAMLEEELKELNFDEFNFNFDGLVSEEEEIVDVHEDDYDVVLPEMPKSQLGDIYQLGDHILMCGDSTKIEDVNALVGGLEDVDLLFTDPPYNVNVSNSEGMTIENDNLDNSDFVTLLDCAFENASKVMKPGACFFCWHGDSERVNFQVCLEKNDLIVKQCLIWVKNGFNFGRQDFKWQHEPCLYGWKEGAGHYFVFEFNHSTVIEDNVDLDKMKKEDLKALCSELLKIGYPSTIVHEDKPLKNDLHPTMKPIVMCSNLIRYTTKKNWKVLDLFGGSGSTLIACEQLGRRCYMMEYDPKYVDVIIDRWEKFTGKKAIKIN